ncbi:MAG TPA: S8 family serine peptidase, partial [Ilumatobacteraceae bacterium]|nr:S8 family serine peptidase [Ilumatobacteraceae bacterium]
YSAFWPNGYPKAVPSLTPPRANVTPAGLPIGTGTKLEVYDTGLAPRGPGELPNVATLASADNELIDIDGDGIVGYPAAGHGKAIAGVIATLAPGAIVQEARVSDRSGLVTDVSAARRMADSLRNLPRQGWPSLMINAFGTVVCDLDPNTPGAQLEPVGLKAVVEVTDRFDPIQPDGMVILASAGNQDSSRENYPAAFDSVLSVGALDATLDPSGDAYSSGTRTGPKAAFSNYGDWVKVWAPGVALRTNHVSGVAFEKGLAVLNGMAAVDGSSFGPPYVGALIAEQMSLTGLDARDAWELIEAQGADPLAECGASPSSAPAGVAVALVSLSSTVTATTPGSGQPVSC